MKTINSLATLRLNSKELQTELAEVFAKYGLKHMSLGATVHPDTGKVKFRLETSYLTAEGEEETARKLWVKFAPAYGMPADAFGKVVTFNGFAYTITGIDLKARKSPVLITRHGDRKVYKASEEAIARALAVKAPTATQS